MQPLGLYLKPIQRFMVPVTPLPSLKSISGTLGFTEPATNTPEGFSNNTRFIEHRRDTTVCTDDDVLVIWNDLRGMNLKDIFLVHHVTLVHHLGAARLMMRSVQVTRGFHHTDDAICITNSADFWSRNNHGTVGTGNCVLKSPSIPADNPRARSRTQLSACLRVHAFAVVSPHFCRESAQQARDKDLQHVCLDECCFKRHSPSMTWTRS